MSGMKLYIWTLENQECSCHYGAMAEEVEKAREIVIHKLTKSKKERCIRCFRISDKDYADMSYEEKRRKAELQYNAPYYIRLWIREAEPKIFEENEMIEF